MVSEEHISGEDSAPFCLGSRAGEVKQLSVSSGVYRDIQTPSVGEPNSCDSAREKNMPKSVGARTHPCFIPLRISNGSDVAMFS